MAIMALAGKNLIRANQIIQCKKECAETGISVTQWCKEHGLKEKSYWCYHKKLSDVLMDIAQYEETIETAAIISGITGTQFAEPPRNSYFERRKVGYLFCKCDYVLFALWASTGWW